MAENLLPALSQAEMDQASRLARADPVQGGPPKSQRAERAEASANAQKSALNDLTQTSQHEQTVKPVEKTANPLTDVTLKFKIDADTNEVTILILDRATRKVVRTIPPEEMNKLKPGELLELFA